MNDEKWSALESLFKAELTAIAALGVETGEKRTASIRVYLTPAEKAKLSQNHVGIGMSDYIRSLLFRDRPLVRRDPLPTVNRDTYIELGRIGRNMNQQTRALYQALQQPDPAIDGVMLAAYQTQLEALTKLLRQIRQTLVPDAVTEVVLETDAASDADTSADAN